jgi:hypothetical protein
MYITAAITALMNIAELIYIGVRRFRVAFCGAYGGVDPMFEDPSEVNSVLSQQTGRASKGEIFIKNVKKTPRKTESQNFEFYSRHVPLKEVSSNR